MSLCLFDIILYKTFCLCLFVFIYLYRPSLLIYKTFCLSFAITPALSFLRQFVFLSPAYVLYVVFIFISPQLTYNIFCISLSPAYLYKTFRLCPTFVQPSWLLWMSWFQPSCPPSHLAFFFGCARRSTANRLFMWT